MATIQNRKPTTATARLKQDYLRLKRDPIPYVTAEPTPSNILEWHYVVSGPENSPYEGGIYHGKLVFPRDFPFKPPSIYILTPNGRFKTNTRLCLSISDFHPDTWNPAWSVSTILTGLLSFMMEKSPTYGSIETTDLEKRQFAYHSLAFNLKDHQFCETFPDIVEKIKEELERRKEAEERLVANGGVANTESGRRGCGTQAHHLTPGGGAIANLCVLVAVAIFVVAVRYVVSNTYIDTQDL